MTQTQLKTWFHPYSQVNWKKQREVITLFEQRTLSRIVKHEVSWQCSCPCACCWIAALTEDSLWCVNVISSYAAAASKNRLPEDQQPHPDPALLEGSHSDESDTDLSHSTATDEKVHGGLFGVVGKDIK